MGLFASLPPEIQAEAARYTIARRFRRGDVMVYEGDPSASVFILSSGHAAVTVGDASGNSITLTVLGPTATFGELAEITGDARRTATVVALDDIEAEILPAPAFEELRRRHAEIDRVLLRLLALRVVDLGARLTQTLHETVQRRCARRLLETAVLFESGEPEVVIPITQDDLAGMAGATRPTVNQVLGQLSEHGIVRLARGKIIVTDVRGLRGFVR